jgi:pimeloyl-ACP methyl ester carboxylesterase
MPTVTVNGRQVSYRKPARQQGHAVLLVHGAYDNGDYWQHVYPHLARAHTPVAVDLPGRRESEGPAIADAAGYARFLPALADALNLPSLVFFGHSMGGSMAIEFAANHPQRTKAVIALGSAPRWGGSQADQDKWDQDPDGAFRDNLPALFAKVASRDVRAAYDRQLRTTPPMTCKADIAHCASVAMDKRLHEIKAPTLVLAGDEEAWIGGSHALRDGIAGARFELIPGAGHAVALERPAALNAAVDRFLATLSV